MDNFNRLSLLGRAVSISFPKRLRMLRDFIVKIHLLNEYSFLLHLIKLYSNFIFLCI